MTSGSEKLWIMDSFLITFFVIQLFLQHDCGLFCPLNSNNLLTRLLKNIMPTFFSQPKSPCSLVSPGLCLFNLTLFAILPGHLILFRKKTSTGSESLLSVSHFSTSFLPFSIPFRYFLNFLFSVCSSSPMRSVFASYG